MAVWLLFTAQTIFFLILFLLLSDIFLYRCSIQSHRTRLVSCRPEISIPKFTSLNYHHCSFPFWIAYETRYTALGWDASQQLHMIRHHISFYNSYAFPLAQIPDDLLNVFWSWLYLFFLRYFEVNTMWYLHTLGGKPCAKLFATRNFFLFLLSGLNIHYSIIFA